MQWNRPDADWNRYLADYPDVAAGWKPPGMDSQDRACDHFLRHGMFEGRKVFKGSSQTPVPGPNPVPNPTPTPISGRIVGYGAPNGWLGGDPHGIGRALRESGLNSTRIEFLPWFDAGHWINPDGLRNSFYHFIDVMRNYGITTFVSFINWNAQKSKGWGPVDICDGRFDDGWFNRILDITCSRGTDKLVLMATNECTSNGRNSQCFQKGRHFSEMLHQRYPGQKMKYGDMFGGPGYYVEHHPGSTGQGVPGSNLDILCTDHGSLLNELGAGPRPHSHRLDPGKVEAYARAKRGHNFLLYDFGQRGYDTAVIAAVGRTR